MKKQDRTRRQSRGDRGIATAIDCARLAARSAAKHLDSAVLRLHGESVTYSPRLHGRETGIEL